MECVPVYASETEKARKMREGGGSFMQWSHRSSGLLTGDLLMGT
jgi:hypothetical protein